MRLSGYCYLSTSWQATIGYCRSDCPWVHEAVPVWFHFLLVLFSSLSTFIIEPWNARKVKGRFIKQRKVAHARRGGLIKHIKHTRIIGAQECLGTGTGMEYYYKSNFIESEL